MNTFKNVIFLATWSFIMATQRQILT